MSGLQPMETNWDEHAWEAFLQRADARVERFLRLHEASRGESDRMKYIADGMGWDKQLECCGGVGDCCDACCCKHACEPYEMLKLVGGDATEAEAEASVQELMHNPAYAAVHRFAITLERAQTLNESLARNDDWQHALLSAQAAASAVAAGHGIGTEADAVCGNIARCREAQRALARAVSRLDGARNNGALPTMGAGRLNELGTAAQEAVAQHIQVLGGVRG